MTTEEMGGDGAYTEEELALIASALPAILGEMLQEIGRAENGKP